MKNKIQEKIKDTIFQRMLAGDYNKDIILSGDEIEDLICNCQVQATNVGNKVVVTYMGYNIMEK